MTREWEDKKNSKKFTTQTATTFEQTFDKIHVDRNVFVSRALLLRRFGGRWDEQKFDNLCESLTRAEITVEV